MTTQAKAKLKVKCETAECEKNLHCYMPKKRSRKSWTDPPGDCRYCADHSVDWERVRRRDLTDLPALRDELTKEWIRNYFWDKPMDDDSKRKLLSDSRTTIRQRIRKRLAASVGPPRPFRDGYAVPVDDAKLVGNPLAYAQHATASCCTKCAYYWWGFERNTQYTEGQIDFLTDLCMGYFDGRGLLPSE